MAYLYLVEKGIVENAVQIDERIEPIRERYAAHLIS